MRTFEAHLAGDFQGNVRNIRNDLTRIGMARLMSNCHRFCGWTPSLFDVNIRFQEETTWGIGPAGIEYYVMTHRGREHRGRRVRYENL